MNIKRAISWAFLFSIAATAAFGQTAGGGKAPSTRFPGVSESDLTRLRAAKLSTPLPLPTWVPAGFKIEKIDMKLGARVPIQDRTLVIVYSRKLANGKMQRFSLEGGFEGLGDLPYDVTNSVRSAVGEIDIAYEPPDLDGGGRKLKGFVMTHWFNVGKTAFHYIGMYPLNETDSRTAMISLSDTEKILRSLQRF